MWRTLEEEAIYIGLDLDYFWRLTPNTYNKHVNAYNKRKKDELEEKDYLNNILGQYIMFAVNNPKKYPEPFLKDKSRNISTNKIMSDEEMEKVMNENMKRLGGTMNDY